MNKSEELFQSIKYAQIFDKESQNDLLPNTRIKAYTLYVNSMKDLFQILSTDLASISDQTNANDLADIQSRHMPLINVAMNCLERSKQHLITKSDQSSTTSSNMLDSLESNSSRTSRSNSVFTNSQPQSLNRNSVDILLSGRALNPIDAAKYKIQKLIQNTNKAISNPKMTPTQRSSMALQLRREIENIQAIARKQETQECLTKTSQLEQFMDSIERKIRSTPQLKNDMKLQDIYKRTQLFYLHVLKDSQWFNLIRHGRNPKEECLRFIIRIDTHPITECLNKSIENLVSLEYNDYENIKVEIEKFNKLLNDLSFICFQTINSEIYDDCSNALLSQDKILIFLMEYTFNNAGLVKFIYFYLMSMLKKEERQYDQNLEYLENNDYKGKLLPSKIQNEPNILKILEEEALQLVNMRDIYNPIDKISRLCKFIQDLLAKIQKEAPNFEIGGDELMPILTFVCVECDTFEIYLHARYIELLLPEDYLMGMEGYVLTTIRCALEFCVSNDLVDRIENM